MMKAKYQRRYLESKRHRNAMFRCAIDVSGFAGVLIALLWAVMGASNAFVIIDSSRVSVDLPKTRHAIPVGGANRKDALIISIKRDGRAYIDTLQVGPEELVMKLRGGFRRGGERKVYLNIDRRCHYRVVEPVLDEIRQAGVERVVVLTTDWRPPSPVR